MGNKVFIVYLLTVKMKVAAFTCAMFLILLMATEISALEQKHAIACEREQIDLSCSVGESIAVIYANYGRTSSAVCSGQRDWESCYSPTTSLSNMRSRCQGSQRCIVSVINSIFSDPCVGVFKYLEVYYFCLCNAGPFAWHCCRNGNCGIGEGDCDRDADCQSGLVCGTNNCQKFRSNAHPLADCCETPVGGVGGPFLFDVADGGSDG